MIELIALAALAAVTLAGLHLIDDRPLDRIDRRLWPYLRH